MKLWIDTGAVDSARMLFGLPPVERLRRSAGKLASAVPVVLSGPGARASLWPGATADADAAPLGSRLRRALRDGPLVAIDGANAIDPRLIAFLVKGGAACIAERGGDVNGSGAGAGDADARAVVLRLDPSHADAIPDAAPDLRAVADALIAAGRIARLADADFPAYVDKLRRSLPYWIYAVDSDATRARLERRMFWDNYKGSTDVLTRWVYPPLVWPLVHLCVRLGIHPNAVTVLSIVLTFAAVPLFARGDFFWGFVCAYGMSVLDSVDGKLARVTLTDSKIGNTLDHGLDQVHPPFWYFAWAWGLGGQSSSHPLWQAAVWMIFFYFADRIVLMIAKRRLGFALHAATRLDGAVRSIIARRNITMTVMALALLVGQGPAGFYAVAAWQALTFAWHALRTVRLEFMPRDRIPEA